MNKDIALRAAKDLVLRVSLKEIAALPRSCKGKRCTEVEGFGWWDYCDPCKAACFLAELFPDKRMALGEDLKEGQ